MTNKKKRWLGLVAALIAVCIIGGLIYLAKVWNYQNKVKNFTYADISIENIEDGTYIGGSNVDFIYAQVAVTVENGAIARIELLEHKNERGALAETIIDDIIQQQTIDVDNVAGATNSSKVIKKAIENALTGL